MKLNRKAYINSFLIPALILTLSIIACANEEVTGDGNEEESLGILMTINGKVNDMSQLVTELGNYEIDFDEKGTELIEKEGKLVEATGYVMVEEIEEESAEEVDDDNEEENEDEVVVGTITVTSYKVVELY